MTKRVAFFDIARAVCMIWVVGFWHVMGYWTAPYDTVVGSDLGQIITWGILATFTFFSGYFLRNKTVTAFTEFLSFYKARFFKFYILYAFSCITLFIAGQVLAKFGSGQLWFKSPNDLAYSLIGLGTYIGEAPATLWYMTMLMSFYFITPFFLYLKGLNRVSFILFLIFLIFLITVNYSVDIRNLMYFPFYCVGLFSPDLNRFFEKKLFIKLVLVAILSIIFITLQLNNSLIFNGFFYINSILIIILLLIFSKIIENNCTNIVPIFLKVSYASMSAFLFHRQIYGILKLVMKQIGITPILTTLIFLPIAFCGAFYLQKSYEYVIDKISS